MRTLWEKKLELFRLTAEAATLRKEIHEEEAKALRSKIRRLPPNQRAALEVLHQTNAERRYNCIYKSSIVEDTGLHRAQVGRALQALIRLGLAEFHRGLFNDDGEVAGSGYCISPEGKTWWEKVEEDLAA